jgi:hypothetical protein
MHGGVAGSVGDRRPMPIKRRYRPLMTFGATINSGNGRKRHSPRTEPDSGVNEFGLGPREIGKEFFSVTPGGRDQFSKAANIGLILTFDK